MKIKLILAFALLPLCLFGAQTNKLDNILNTGSFQHPVAAGVGKVFTSDANGFGDWQNLSSLGGADVFTTSNNTFVVGRTNTFNGQVNASNLTVFSGAMISTNSSPQTNSFSYSTFRANNAATGRIISFLKQSDGSFLGHIRESGDGIDFNGSAFGTFALTSAGFNMSPAGGVLNLFSASMNISAGNLVVGGAGAGMISGSRFYASSNLVVDLTTTLGTNGTAFHFLKTATATLDYGNILAAGTADLQITLTGATTNDIVMMGRPASEDPSLVTRGIVLSNNVVTVRANNVGGIAVDQAPMTYRIDVIHH